VDSGFLAGAICVLVGVLRLLPGAAREDRPVGGALLLLGGLLFSDPLGLAGGILPLALGVGLLVRRRRGSPALLSGPAPGAAPSDDRIEHLKRVFE
jgi:hypothetical protein